MKQVSVAEILALFNSSPTELANQIGGDVKRQNVEYWLRVDGIPAQHRPAVELATGGVVPCEAMPGTTAVWKRVRDKSWPHPDGRPCLDVARVAA